MRKVSKWFGRGALAMAVLSLVWINFTPTAHDRAEIDQILTRQQQQWDLAQQNYANDKAQNLFLHPDLHPVWALKTEHAQPNQLSNTLEEFGQFNTYEPIKELDKGLARLGKTREQFQAARKKFQAITPQLEAASKMPCFMAPLTPPGKLSGRTVVPNFLGIRRLTQDCAFEARLRIHDGQPDRAVPLAMVGVRLGGLMLRTPGVMIYKLVGVFIQFMGIEVLQEALLTEKLQTESLKSILTVLPLYQPPADSLVNALEAEVLMVHNSVNDPNFPIQNAFDDAEGKKVSSSDRIQDWLLRRLGLVARELRIYDNTMMTLVQAAREGHLSKLTLPDPSQIWRCELKGTDGLLSLLLVPNANRASFQLDLLRTRLSALQVMAALQLYHHQEKKYPGDLGDLRQVGLEGVPQAPISQAGFQYRLVSAEPELSLALKPELADYAKATGKDIPVQDGKIFFLSPQASKR